MKRKDLQRKPTRVISCDNRSTPPSRWSGWIRLAMLATMHHNYAHSSSLLLLHFSRKLRIMVEEGRSESYIYNRRRRMRGTLSSGVGISQMLQLERILPPLTCKFRLLLFFPPLFVPLHLLNLDFKDNSSTTPLRNRPNPLTVP